MADKTMEDYPSLGKRVIRHGLFWHYVPETSVVGGEEKVALVQHTAFQGQEVELFLQSDLDRGVQFDAFYPEGFGPHNPGQEPVIVGTTHPEGAGADDEEEEVDLADLDHEDLVDWLTSTGAFDGEKKPTAAQVIEGVGDDPELADRMLKAETEASGGEPRKSVKEKLEAVKDGDGS